MRFKNIEEVVANEVLALPLYDDHNRLLVNSGIKLTNNIIKKIENLGISGVYIDDELSKGIEIEPILDPNTQSKIIRHLKSINIDKALNDAKKIVETLKNQKKFCDYINIKTFDNYTYEHSLSVSIYATLVAIACGFKEKELENISLSGLLHDLGKKCIDDFILNKPDKLTDDEYEEIKKHSSFGYNIVKDDFQISATIKTTIYEHHENEDGTGYPRHLKGNEIYKFAKIIHIVDVYDALISKRPYKNPLPPVKALDYIKEKTGTMFDPYYVDIFMKIVPAYPKGLMVELSNGEKGIVIENYTGFVLRPKIRLINGKEISLKDDIEYKDIEIVK